jgi:hypothetical protein
MAAQKACLIIEAGLLCELHGLCVFVEMCGVQWLLSACTRVLGAVRGETMRETEGGRMREIA